MPRLFSICLLALSAVTLIAVSPAAAAKKGAKASTPSITRVKPMRVSVGDPLTISGRNFKPRRTRNTVIFRSSSGRTAFAKPRRASRAKLVVVVPAAVSRLLKVDDGRQKPTRLKLRVLAGKFSKYTTRRLSPVVTGAGTSNGAPGPGGGGGAGAVVCDSDADHDNDLLNNGLELFVGTDPCLADTDSDGMIDGWEYWSAKDLNIKALPYPGSRPFPNALDPSDGGPRGATFSKIDFDGDGLTTLEEYRAWTVHGSSFDESRIDRNAGVLLSPPDLQSALGYSDGTKFSRDDETPSNPPWRSGSFPDYGLPHPSTYFAYPSVFNLHGDAAWRDDERDADADGLSNRLESARGPSKNAWWKGFWAQEAIQIEPWKKKSYCGVRPGHFDERPFAELDLADGDVDGDGLLDGEDDQDHDDYVNVKELYELSYDWDGNGNPAWCTWGPGLIPTLDVAGVDVPVNAFNPCVPNPSSRTCADYIPFD